MEGNLLIYNPTAFSRLQLDASSLKQPLLKGATVGIMDNTKPMFRVLATHLGQVLRERYGVRNVVYRKKGGPAGPAPASTYVELAEECDLVIIGAAD